MSVGILIIGHDNVGESLRDNAVKTFGAEPLPLAVVSIGRDCEPERAHAQASAMIQALDQGDGVLVLTDICGATPCNIATRLLGEARVKIVTGVNLPMLLRVLNYADLGLERLVDKAITGGRDGIVEISDTD
ncbi:MAG: PTS sugar transporter subunit IIA [Pseudomonadota bacterium]|nr:PTS sugar transporter subunit IIA [Pseudomonadota bacterium]